MKNKILKDSADFNFFQAVYLLERMGYAPKSAFSGTQNGKLKFYTENSIRFPASDIAGIDINDDENEISMYMTFMGLYGVSSPLPSYFNTSILLEKEEFLPLKKFLDIYGHRIYALFYRAWKEYRHDKNFKNDGTSKLTRILSSLLGRASLEHGKENDISGELKKLFFGRFSQAARSAENLETLISGYFNLPNVRVKQFSLRWEDNPSPFKLGNSSVKLGGGMHLGNKIQDRTGSFSIEIGPVSYGVYQMFIADKRAGGQSDGLGSKIRDLVEDYIKDPLDFAIKVYLDTETLPPAALGSDSAIPGACLWLGEKPSEPVYLTV